MFRHGAVHERKKIDGRWFVRLRIGSTDEKPFLSPWIPYSSPNGGPAGLNLHRVPARGEQLTMLSPAGDFRQAVATSLFWSDDHPPPSEDENAVVVTHPKFKLTMKDGLLQIETQGDPLGLKIETTGDVDIQCRTFTLKGTQGGELSLVNGKMTLKADIIETDGETHLDKGSQPVHRMNDHDSDGDIATEGAPRVLA
jgi:phage baseplate assembly protein gpV